MKRPISLLLLGALLGSSMPMVQAASHRVSIKDHVPKQIQEATRLERAPADEPVDLGLVVRLDQKLLDQTLAELYGPQAPAGKHFLSASEFAQKFDLANK